MCGRDLTRWQVEIDGVQYLGGGYSDTSPQPDARNTVEQVKAFTLI